MTASTVAEIAVNSQSPRRANATRAGEQSRDRRQDQCEHAGDDNRVAVAAPDPGDHRPERMREARPRREVRPFDRVRGEHRPDRGRDRPRSP